MKVYKRNEGDKDRQEKEKEIAKEEKKTKVERGHREVSG